jgi:hypothetical protein
MEKLKEFGKKLMYGRKDYSPKVKKILKDFGDETITKMAIMRTPISSVLRKIMNIVSLGEFEKRLKDTPYDDLYHLSLLLYTDKGTILVEKNEVINMEKMGKVPKVKKGSQISSMRIKGKRTINELLNKAKERMGDKYFPYSAKNNNCQDFIMNVLQANNLGTKTNFDFIKQDTKSLFSSHLRKASNTVTDLAGRLDVLAQGGSVGETQVATGGAMLSDKKKKELAHKLADKIVGSGLFDDIGSWFSTAVDDVKDTFSTKKLKKIAKSAIPVVTAGIGSVAGLAGTTAGHIAGTELADKIVGDGVTKRKARFEKGSQEAKDYMKMLREKRGKK